MRRIMTGRPTAAPSCSTGCAKPTPTIAIGSRTSTRSMCRVVRSSRSSARRAAGRARSSRPTAGPWHSRDTTTVPFPIAPTRAGRAQPVARLTTVNADVLDRIHLGATEPIWYVSTGGARVEGWIIKPPNFDRTKKYPLIMEIHGGPHGMYNGAFSYQNQNFAANGYVVLITNPRGSTGYGSTFGNAIERAYPSVDYDDLMAGVDTVVGRGYIDAQRMYVGGCSGGGVLSSWVIGHTTRFAAAAVRCPVIDWMSMAGANHVPPFTLRLFLWPVLGEAGH